MKKEIIFSIITVCYNAEDVLEDTILSVINQNFRHFQYIIIDGNSSDGSLRIIQKYKDKIDDFIREPDAGIYDAMNKGLSLAKGQFVNFLNAGDRFILNTTLNEIANSININETKIISGDFVLIDDSNSKQRLIKTRDIAFKNLRKDFYACHQSIFIDRKIANKYDVSYKIKADYKWVIEALYQTTNQQVLKLDIPIVLYSKEGFSNNLFIKNLQELIRIHYEFFGIQQVIKNLHIYTYRLLRSFKDKILH